MPARGQPSAAEPNAPHATWRRVRALLRPQRGPITLVLGAVIVMALLRVANSLLIKAVFDDAIAHRDARRLFLFAGLMVLAAIGIRLVDRWQTIQSAKIGQSVIRGLRDRLYSHLQRVPFSFFTETPAGAIHSRFTNDISGLQDILKGTAPEVVSKITMLLSALTAMFYMAPMLTLLSLLLLPLVLINTHHKSKVRRKMSRLRQKALAGISAFLAETVSVSGALLIRISGRQQHVSDRFKQQCDELMSLELQQLLQLRSGSLLVFRTFFDLIPALMYLLAGWQLIHGSPLFGVAMTAGTLVAFVSLQDKLFGPAKDLLDLRAELQNSVVLFERVFEYLDLPVTAAAPADSLQPPPSPIAGALALHEVSFSYRAATDTAAAPALRGVHRISFAIKPGAVTAVVGPSGAGKTTLAYLIARLHEPDSGTITIDGHDIRNFPLATLTDLLGVVTQETFLLDASIHDNLLFACPTATREQMHAAATAAALHDRIVELASGYDTVVGERGYKLSGGEKQRLALARAILKNPRILILDEATSSLDTESEARVQTALADFMHDRTTLVIAHRLSTIIAADTILVLDEGEIVDRGTHPELLQRCRLYRDLYFQRAGSNAAPADIFPAARDDQLALSSG